MHEVQKVGEIHVAHVDGHYLQNLSKLSWYYPVGQYLMHVVPCKKNPIPSVGSSWQL